MISNEGFYRIMDKLGAEVPEMKDMTEDSMVEALLDAVGSGSGGGGGVPALFVSPEDDDYYSGYTGDKILNTLLNGGNVYWCEYSTVSKMNRYWSAYYFETVNSSGAWNLMVCFACYDQYNTLKSKMESFSISAL